MTSKQRKWLVAGIKLAIVGLLVWGVHRTLIHAYDDLHQHPLHLNPAWLVAAGALYLFAMLPSALFWQRVMRAMGQRVGIFAAIRAYYIGSLGKYVPGKALVVVLRSGLVRGPGVSGAVAAVSVFVETLTMMASGSFLAAALITMLYGGQNRSAPGAPASSWDAALTTMFHGRMFVAIAIAFMLASGVPTLPPVFRRLIRLTRIGRADPDAAQQLERIGYGTLLLGWLATGIGWFLMGLSFTAVLHGMVQTSSATPMPGWQAPAWIGGLPLTTMVVCVSVVAGFMSFIPSGLGVRDLVMFELILPQLGSEVAVASAIVLRLVWLVAELSAAGVLYLIRAKPQASATPNPIAPSNSVPP